MSINISNKFAKFIYFNTIDDEYVKHIEITNIEEPKENNQYIEVNIDNITKNEVNKIDNNIENEVNNDYKTDFNENIIKDIKIEIDKVENENEHKIKVIYEDISSNNQSNSDLSSLTNE